MTILKAEVAQVNLGCFEVEGLMDENGDYYIGVPQLSELNLVPPNRSIKQLESLSGKALQSHEIVKLKTTINPKAVNALPVRLFEKLLLRLAINGNQQAIVFMEALIGLSLQQLFSDAFGVKFEIEERQRWLIARFNTKHDFRPLTDQLQVHGFKRPQEYARFIKLMQAKIGLESGTRDLVPYEVLNRLERTQTRLTSYMECGIKPYQALAKL